MSETILAYDIGTTHIKASLMSVDNFKSLLKASEPAIVEYPKSGWAEQDPEVLWNQIVTLTKRLLEDGEGNYTIKGIVFSAHMAGVVPVDSEGNPLRKMIIWLDERAAGYPRDLWSGFPRVQGYNLFRLIEFLRVTGGVPGRTGKDPLSKILWLRDNEPDIYSKTFKFLDVKGYLISRATGAFVTSPDEANLTWLADTRKGRAVWHEPLLRRYGIPRERLPEIKLTTEIAGYLKRDSALELGLDEGIPVVVGAGDLTAAAIGSGAVSDGEIHIYIGTSDWVAAHLSERKLDINHYIGSILSGIPGKYLLVAEQEIAAGALEWLMRIEGIEGRYDVIEKLLEEAEPGAGGVLFAPWMYGERSPIDDPYVRGSFINLSLSHDRKHLVRAVVEGIVLNIKWVYGYVERLAGVNEKVNLVGGAALFDSLCTMLASAINRRIVRLRDPQDATLRGSAAIAAKGLGLVDSIEGAANRFLVDKEFQPNKELVKVYDEIYEYFVEMYKRLKKLYRKLNKSRH